MSVMFRRQSMWVLVLALACAMGKAAIPSDAASAAPAVAAPSAVPTPAEAKRNDAQADADDDDDADDADSESDWDRRAAARAHRHEHRRNGNSVVSIGHDSTLAAGEHADSVVSVLGSSTSNGEATDVVSILGDTRVTGSVVHSAVAVLGNTYVDGKVGDAVAVLGNVELGPHAEVDGDVTAVLGTVNRDPAAIVHGGIQKVAGGSIASVAWLQTWVHHCLFYGRPLALDADLGWAWGLALGYLAFYVVLAFLFRSALTGCVRMVETEPGRAALTALVAILLTPVAVVLLCVTVIGIAAVPFVAVSLFCASLFGKAVMLAWIGQHLLGRRPGTDAHPALAVLLGGAVVLVLYIVPVLGFLVYQLLGFFGFGAVLYALIAHVRSRQISKADAAALRSGGAVPPSAAAAAAAAPAGDASGASTAPPGSGAPAHAAPPASASMPRAGFWIRMTALLLDVILIGIVLSLLHPLGHFHLLVLAVYGAVMWKTRGSTVGGLVFDLHVVRLDGRAVDWETAIVRALGCFLSLAVAGLGFIWIAFDRGHQAWHDKIAGTVVVRVPKG